MKYRVSLPKNHEATEREIFTVHPPRIHVVLGFFAAVLWVAFIIFLSFIEIEGGSNTSNAFIDALINYGWMILIVFVMIGYSIMLLIWRIKVTSKRLVVKNFFGIEKSYPIDQITHTRKRTGKILLHMGEKRIAKVELLYTNADSLLILFETAVKEENGWNTPFVE